MDEDLDDRQWRELTDELRFHIKRADEAIAELDEMLKKKCGNCLYWLQTLDLGVGDCNAVKRFCITNVLKTDEAFSCSYWQPKQ
jgi:hypothetical protein